MKSTVSIHDAVKAVLGFAQELYGLQDVKRLTLEEVEPTEDERFWMVTLGVPATLQPVEVIARRASSERYKVFKVDADTGEVLSMKIRSTA
jgi:hypothetical protein